MLKPFLRLSPRSQRSGPGSGVERDIVSPCHSENLTWKAGGPAINVPSRLRYEQPATPSPQRALSGAGGLASSV